MDREILTPEELHEREELFKHEMTQVFLALKDQYTNTDNIKSPLEGLELTAEDINRKLDYEPMKAPRVSKSPLEGLELTAEDINSKLDYVPMKAPGVDNIPKDIPVTNILTQYTAITDLQPTIAFEGIEDIPLAGISTVFTPLTEINAERITQSIPDAKITVQYAALQSVKIDSFSVDVPTIGSTRPYAPAVPEFPIIKAVDIPLLSKPPDFTPLEEIKANPVKVDVPMTKSKIIHKKHKVENKGLPKIDVPVIRRIPKYESIKDVSIETPVKSLPKHEITIGNISKTIVEHTKLSPEFALVAEKAAPKDFYSMWTNMQTTSGL